MSISVLPDTVLSFPTFLPTESLFYANSINGLFSKSIWVNASLLENQAQSRVPRVHPCPLPPWFDNFRISKPALRTMYNYLFTYETWIKTMPKADIQLTMALDVLMPRLYKSRSCPGNWQPQHTKLRQDAPVAEVPGTGWLLHERQASWLHVLAPAAILPLGSML